MKIVRDLVYNSEEGKMHICGGNYINERKNLNLYLISYSIKVRQSE